MPTETDIFGIETAEKMYVQTADRYRNFSMCEKILRAVLPFFSEIQPIFKIKIIFKWHIWSSQIASKQLELQIFVDRHFQDPEVPSRPQITETTAPRRW